jgi:hypothetical protein
MPDNGTRGNPGLVNIQRDNAMELLTSLDTKRQLLLKYSSRADFDPFSMRTLTLRSFFDESMQSVRRLE